MSLDHGLRVVDLRMISMYSLLMSTEQQMTEMIITASAATLWESTAKLIGQATRTAEEDRVLARLLIELSQRDPKLAARLGIPILV